MTNDYIYNTYRAWGSIFINEKDYFVASPANFWVNFWVLQRRVIVNSTIEYRKVSINKFWKWNLNIKWGIFRNLNTQFWNFNLKFSNFNLKFENFNLKFGNSNLKFRNFDFNFETFNSKFGNFHLKFENFNSKLGNFHLKFRNSNWKFKNFNL